MSSVNKVFLIGRLGQDPEVRATGSGKSVCNFSLATDGGKDETVWHRIVCWEKTAENVGRYLKKGRQCCVEGRIQQRKYEDKDGAQRTSFEIVAYTVTFLSSPQDDRKPADVVRRDSGKADVDPDSYPF